jgi:hypothetical protein
MFKKAEKAFYFVAFFIKFFVNFTPDFPVFFRENNGDCSFIFNGFYDFIRVITFIRQDGFRPDSIQQSDRLGVQSLRFPPVMINFSGLPSAPSTAWIFDVNPPFERPKPSDS